MTHTASVIIMGAGALGSAIGGTLADNGASVTLVTRNRQHRDAIEQNGLILASGAGVKRSVRLAVHPDCSSLNQTFGVAIILTHSSATADAARDLLPVLRSDSVVFSLQNGLGQEDLLRDIIGRDRVLGGKTYVGGLMLAPGKIQATVDGKRTLIGELDGTPSTRALATAAHMTAHGVPTEVPDDIRVAIWDKLLVNVATGALSSITRMPYGELYARREIAHVAQAAVAEAMAVAHASGVALSFSEPEQAWALASAGLPDNFKTSMLSTILKGGRSEIDFINGAVVARGAKLGVPTPVNATLVACIKAIETSTAFAAIDGRSAL